LRSNEIGLVLETATSRTLFSGRLFSSMVCAMRSWTSEMLVAMSIAEGVSSVLLLLGVDMFLRCCCLRFVDLLMDFGVMNVEIDAADR